MKKLIDSIKYLCNYRLEFKLNLVKPVTTINQSIIPIDPLVLKICKKIEDGEFKRCEDVGFGANSAIVKINDEIVNLSLSRIEDSIHIVLRSVGEIYEIDKHSSKYLYSTALKANLFGVWLNKIINKKLYNEAVARVLA